MLSISGLGATLFLAGVGTVCVSGWCLRGFGFSEGDAFDLRVHLGARHAAPVAPGSVDELRVKFVLPLTLLNLFDAALWRFLGEGWDGGVCSAILLVAYG